MVEGGPNWKVGPTNGDNVGKYLKRKLLVATLSRHCLTFKILFTDSTFAWCKRYLKIRNKSTGNHLQLCGFMVGDLYAIQVCHTCGNFSERFKVFFLGWTSAIDCPTLNIVRDLILMR